MVPPSRLGLPTNRGELLGNISGLQLLCCSGLSFNLFVKRQSSVPAGRVLSLTVDHGIVGQYQYSITQYQYQYQCEKYYR